MTTPAETPARVAFLEHSDADRPGLLGAAAAALGLSVLTVRADRADVPLPVPADFDYLVVLGSSASVYDAALAWIARERALVEASVAGGVPVLGVCFGGQLLSEVLGGRVAPASRREIGWSALETDDAALVAPGPWLLWHSDAFSVPPAGIEIARTEVCPQAFSSGPHVGLQFHPEVTPGLVDRWTTDAETSGELTAAMAATLRREARAHAPGAPARARTLFDAFVSRGAGTVPASPAREPRSAD
jgi:GMP synthase-like glutamine amidotransferase